MTKHSMQFIGTKRGLAALAFIALTLSALFSTHGRAAGAAPVECEGTACQQVTLSFDEAKGQYRAKNNSTEGWVRVSASNLTASASVCLAPGAQEYLGLKSIVGTYRAEQAEPRCGGQGFGQ